MTNPGTVAIGVLALLTANGAAADVPRLANDSTIIISADESWEDANEDTIHFRGNFELRTPGWAVMAEEATVYGQLDDPKRVVAEGSPVRFIYQKSAAEPGTATYGEGEHLQYDREKELLSLSGNAKLTNGENVMQSSQIRYDLEQQRLEAGGPEGVRITLDPEQVTQ